MECYFTDYNRTYNISLLLHTHSRNSLTDFEEIRTTLGGSCDKELKNNQQVARASGLELQGLNLVINLRGSLEVESSPVKPPENTGELTF